MDHTTTTDVRPAPNSRRSPRTFRRLALVTALAMAAVASISLSGLAEASNQPSQPTPLNPCVLSPLGCPSKTRTVQVKHWKNNMFTAHAWFPANKKWSKAFWNTPVKFHVQCDDGFSTTAEGKPELDPPDPSFPQRPAVMVWLGDFTWEMQFTQCTVTQELPQEMQTTVNVHAIVTTIVEDDWVDFYNF